MWFGFCTLSYLIIFNNIVMNFDIKVRDTSTWFIKVSFLEGSINLTFDGAHFAVSKLVG